MEKNSMKIFFKMFVALLFSISYCAYANDSTASVRVGGLELLKTDDIQMVSEVLEISTKKIRVKYHFLNTSDKDIKTTVAFPMPSFSPEYGTTHLYQPLDSFRSFVNGAEVKITMNRAFLDRYGNDVTDKLKSIGLTDEQIFLPDFSCVKSTKDYPGKTCPLTPSQYANLEELLPEFDGEIKETAYWEQTFRAGKEIEVVHEYKPFAGAKMTPIYSGFLHSGQKIEDVYKDVREPEACLDEKTNKAIRKYWMGRSKEYGGMDNLLTVVKVEYILGTGRNWKGPIKNFKLVIHKDGGIISLCFPGEPKRINKETIEFSQADYVPQDVLKVFYFVVGDHRGDYAR
jgi:hypothetical protein